MFYQSIHTERTIEFTCKTEAIIFYNLITEDIPNYIGYILLAKSKSLGHPKFKEVVLDKSTATGSPERPS